MRRNADVAPGIEESVEAAEEVRAHRLELAVGERRRLDVDALAEPDVVEPGKVAHRPPQVRLHDDAEVVVAVGPQLAIEPQRLVGGRRVLHVDADEVAALTRVLDDRLEVFLAECVVEPEAERGQLHGDVRVEALLADPRQRVVVLARDRARFVGARDLLAEHVDGRHLPARV